MRIVARLPGRASIPPCRLGEVRTADGLIVYLVLAPGLYERRGSPYCRPDGAEWPDNDLRFARLSLAAARDRGRARRRCAGPPNVHVNDWPGGLARPICAGTARRSPTVLTIHNIAYQGEFDADQRHALGIPEPPSTSTAWNSMAAFRS